MRGTLTPLVHMRSGDKEIYQDINYSETDVMFIKSFTGYMAR